MDRSRFRIIAATIAGVSLVAGLTSCAANDSKDGTVTIRFAQFGNSTDDASGMANDVIKAAIEEKLNIKLEYDTGSDGFDDRMLTELAVGTGPDLFPTWGETEKITKWISDEAVVDIGALVAAEPNRYPTLAKVFASDEYRSYNSLYAGDSDKTYAIYSIASLPKPSFGGVPLYNTAILDEINGGEVPETVDEFIEFTTKAAAAGYTGWWPRNDKLTNWAEIDQTIAQPQGTSIAPPKDNPWTGFVPNGNDTWKLMTTSEESKAVVEQLAAMYDANALSKGVGVKGDFDDAYAEFGTGSLASVNFGFGYAGQFRDFYKSAWEKANPDTAQVTDLTPGLALEGSAGYAQAYSTFSWMGAHYFIPATAKNPDRVLDLIEFLASDEGQDLLYKGIEATTYNAGVDGEPEYIDGAWNSINKAYGVEDGRGKYVWFSYLFSATEMMTEFATEDWYTSVSNPVDYSAQWASALDTELVDRAQPVIDTYVDNVVVPLPQYYNLVVLDPEAQAIRTQLQEISNRYLAGMIGGQIDIDAEWASYQADYEKAGSETYEALVNDAIAKAKALS